MPSYARKDLLSGNLVYHLFNRANAKVEIYHEEEDYQYFKVLLVKYCDKADVKIYHYCIISTHYHLLLELVDPESLSSIMAKINRLYSVYHHKKFGTIGFLWQGRFKSKPIQKETYLLRCARYIERNPVSDGIVSRAEEYPYSSAPYYVLGKEDEIISEDPFFQQYGGTAEERRQRYRDLLSIYDKEEEKKYTSFERPIGDPAFINKLYRKRRLYLPRKQGRIRADSNSGIKL